MNFKRIESVSECGIPIQSSFPKYLKTDIIFEVFPSLSNLLDDDGLILWEDLLKEFDHLTTPGASNLGYFKSKTNEYTIMLHPFFRRSFTRINNFSPNLIDTLIRLYYKYKNKSLKVALDSDCIMLTKDWHGICEREHYYGAPFQNDIPANKEGCVEYTADSKENILTGSVATQFYWKNKGNIFQLEVEEIRDCEKPNLNDDYGCKYIHTIYDKGLSQFIHLDGAIRKYDLDAIINRQSVPLDKSGKESEYTKLFRADGNIPFQLWKRIISSFSPYNKSIIDYFTV